MNATSAKQFLISKVTQEAESSHVHLSEVERKMLYFTEAHPTLPDILEVNAEFERNYDSEEYEDRIARLLKNARVRDNQLSPTHEQEWKEALDALKKEDHYILVMAAQAFSNSGAGHRFRDFVIYIVVGIGVVVAMLWWSFKH